MNGDHLRTSSLRIVILGGGLITAAAVSSLPVNAATIIDEWKSIDAPNAPKLKPVTLDTKTTALLMLDIQTTNCNQKRRPRCVAGLPKVVGLLNKARSRGVAVVYSLTSRGTQEHIRKEVAPQAGEPYVKASVNKFYKTDLEKILRAKNIQTVILVGTSAEGAVMNTATAAAARKFKIVVPVDGMSSSNTYGEQYTTYHLAKGPGVRRRTTLTSINQISFK